MSAIFRFKQFNIDQSNCAMRVNTDGVLLGVLPDFHGKGRMLDIGAGTGVVSLICAQRFPDLMVDAVEIDAAAAQTASLNFAASPFAERLRCVAAPFQSLPSSLPLTEGCYDLILSNPPFFLASLKNPNPEKHVARHADDSFFEELFAFANKFLSARGELCMVLPPDTARQVLKLASAIGFNVFGQISLHSFQYSDPHRFILRMSKEIKPRVDTDFTIYEAPKVYSQGYAEALRDFFTIF